MLEQVRVLENPLFIGIQMALYTSQDFLLEQELRRDMMQSLFFKIHYVNLMESIFKSHLSALASPEPTQKSIQTMLLIYQHMMNKRKLETFCIKSMTLSPFTSASVMNCKK